MYEVTRAHEKPCLHGLAVPAAVAVTGRAAELDRLEISSVDVEQRQRGVTVGAASRVIRMVPADAWADVVAESPELRFASDERAQIVEC